MHAVLTAGRAPYRLGLRRSWRERVVSYGLLAPATVLFAIFMFYPLLYTLYLSFFDWNMTRPTKEFVGLETIFPYLPTLHLGNHGQYGTVYFAAAGI